MEIKVREMSEVESKSTQQVEQELLEKHEQKQATPEKEEPTEKVEIAKVQDSPAEVKDCLLYTSPSPRDRTRTRMPSSA